MTESDASLVLRARSGEAAAFEVLVRRHLRSAYAVALAQLGEEAEAEDAAQDAFMTALQRLETCSDPERFSSWLLGIVRNRARDRRRRMRVRDALPLEAAGAAAGRDDPLADAERAELRADLLDALATLTPAQREIVLLFDLEGFSHREIAARLGISEGSARVQLFHGRRALRARLADRHREDA
jgi:RNA polymerase sigma-70 factor, ECF subfamily